MLIYVTLLPPPRFHFFAAFFIRRHYTARHYAILCRRYATLSYATLIAALRAILLIIKAILIALRQLRDAARHYAIHGRCCHFSRHAPCLPPPYAMPLPRYAITAIRLPFSAACLFTPRDFYATPMLLFMLRHCYVAAATPCCLPLAAATPCCLPLRYAAESLRPTAIVTTINAARLRDIGYAIALPLHAIDDYCAIRHCHTRKARLLLLPYDVIDYGAGYYGCRLRRYAPLILFSPDYATPLRYALDDDIIRYAILRY